MLRKAFTLVELVIVILILGVLAAIAAPKLFDVMEESEVATTLANVQVILDAVERYHADHASLPGDVNRGIFPPDLDGYLHERVFTNPGPLGSLYDWDGPGTSKPVIALAIVFPRSGVSSTEFYQRIEQAIDDGDSSTGWVTASGARICFFVADK